MLNLPTDRLRAEARHWRSARVPIQLGQALSRAVSLFAADLNTPPTGLLLAAYLTLLHRYTSQDEVIVGCRFARPSDGGVRGPIVQIRANFQDGLTVAELTGQIHRAIDAGDEPEPIPHSGLPRGQSVETEAAASDAGQVLFSFGGPPDPHPQASPPPWDLWLHLGEGSDGFAGLLDYNAELFHAATIERLGGHLITLLERAIAEPTEAAIKLSMLTPDERHQLLHEWNDTIVDFPADSCLHQLFEAQVERQPDAVAVICLGTEVSYGALNRRANQLAHFLTSAGVGPEVLVGLCIERSIEMVVGLLAIHKAGGAYVPLDPAYPKDRIALMLEDSRVPVVLTQQHLLDIVQPCDARIVCVDSEQDAVSGFGVHNPASGVAAGNLAYVIYTSGSTGRPKGAMLDHRGRVNNFCDFNRRFDVGPGDRLLALSSPSFDMSAYDVFGTLAAGATIVVPEPAATLDPARWAQMMVEHEITVWHSVPALLELLVDHIGDRSVLQPRWLRLVLLGGDWIPLALPARITALASGCRVISMGGATEVSMDSTIFEIDAVRPEWKSIPYGAPMANQLAYVLDPKLGLVPVGVPGELHLGGIGVGRGYLNRPELTAEKFIPNPFRRGERLYKTGDLARWRPDGNLELLGRIDFQVKIRGFRVELGEIEAALRKHESVRECVVLARGTPPRELRLVAYVVQNAGDKTSGQDGAESQEAQVAQWRMVYDAAYSRVADHGDPTFNIASWDSSYSGSALPTEQMREWVDRTCERILELRPRRVLEIGCGTGLLLFRIAPACDVYAGTDISPVALDYVREQLAALPLPQVSLYQLAADDFSPFESGGFDTIVLNSVVLDFPNSDYLTRVLRGAARLLAPGGAIFIGDIRGLSSQEALATSIQLHRAADSLPVAQLRNRIRNQVRLEEELLLDPQFFEALPDHVPEINHVAIQLKRSVYDNEMAKFRYDAVLCACDETDGPPPITHSHDWQWENLSLDWVRQQLVNTRPERLAIARVPNARILFDVAVTRLLRDESAEFETAGQLRGFAMEQQKQTGIDPEEFWRIGDDCAYVARVAPAHDGGVEYFDVVFLRAAAEGSSGRTLVPNYPPRPAGPLSDYANDPARGKLARMLVPSLRRHLAERLPEYMVPSAFVVLDAFPLSPNGKVNRRALPEPDTERPDLEETLVEPSTPVEILLADIWAAILGMERIGTRDGFVQLGGSSLLAAQAATRIRETLGVDVPLTSVHRAPLGELAIIIEQTGRACGLDVPEIARAVLEVAALSDNEVSSTLTAGGKLS